MRKTIFTCDYCGCDIIDTVDEEYTGDAKHFLLSIIGYNTFAITNKLGLELCEECGTKVKEMLEKGKNKKIREVNYDTNKDI